MSKTLACSMEQVVCATLVSARPTAASRLCLPHSKTSTEPAHSPLPSLPPASLHFQYQAQDLNHSGIPTTFPTFLTTTIGPPEHQHVPGVCPVPATFHVAPTSVRF